MVRGNCQDLLSKACVAGRQAVRGAQALTDMCGHPNAPYSCTTLKYPMLFRTPDVACIGAPSDPAT
jgi:hypothetical protein